MDRKHEAAVRVGDVTLGEGIPKLCVPVMGHTLEEIRAAAARAAQAGADLMELRMDSLSPMPSQEEARAACAAAREGGGLPLLFTAVRRDLAADVPGRRDVDLYVRLPF